MQNAVFYVWSGDAQVEFNASFPTEDSGPPEACLCVWKSSDSIPSQGSQFGCRRTSGQVAFRVLEDRISLNMRASISFRAGF